jgi:hypothetical protein
MDSEDVERLLEQLESVTSSPPQDAELQQRLYNAALKLKLAVEAPLDTVYRVIYSVRRTFFLAAENKTNKSSPCSSAVPRPQRI